MLLPPSTPCFSEKRHSWTNDLRSLLTLSFSLFHSPVQRALGLFWGKWEERSLSMSSGSHWLWERSSQVIWLASRCGRQGKQQNNHWCAHQAKHPKTLDYKNPSLKWFKYFRTKFSVEDTLNNDWVFVVVFDWLFGWFCFVFPFFPHNIYEAHSLRKPGGCFLL